LLAALLLMPPDCGAAEGDRDITGVGYEFAHWLGSGLYRIGDRDVWNILLPFAWELREPAQDHPGMRVLLPVTIGWLDTAGIRRDNLRTLTFVPGLELRFQPTPGWSLRPFAQAGVGGDFSNGENGWVYAGGIKSRFETRLDDYTLILGNALVAAGWLAAAIASPVLLRSPWKRFVGWIALFLAVLVPWLGKSPSKIAIGNRSGPGRVGWISAGASSTFTTSATSTTAPTKALRNAGRPAKSCCWTPSASRTG
jgi:hypothetical protein